MLPHFNIASIPPWRLRNHPKKSSSMSLIEKRRRYSVAAVTAVLSVTHLSSGFVMLELDTGVG
jgi:hypothetical protein